MLTDFRFYTVDYTPQNLTNWGFQAASYDVNVNGGGVFYKLVLNALPNHYAKNSIYVHHPLTVPDENKVIMKDLKQAYLYDFSKPKKQPVVQNITSFEACKTLFQNAATNTSLSAIAPSSIVVDEKTCQPSSTTDAQTLTAFRNYLTTKPNKKYVTQFFKNVTTDLLQKHSYKLAGVPEVDIIRDVSNLAQVHFAACVFALPLKTDSNPEGAFEASELWTILTALYSSIHTTSNPVEAFSAQIAAQGALKGLGEMVVNNVKAAHPEARGWIEWGMHLLSHQHTGDLTDQSAHLIQEMIKTGVKPENLTYNYLLPIAAAIVVSQARAFADCLAYILPRDGKSEILSTVQKLAAADTEQADAEIEGIVLEALRMNAKTAIYVTSASSVSVTEGGKPLAIAPNQTVLCDVVSCEFD